MKTIILLLSVTLISASTFAAQQMSQADLDRANPDVCRDYKSGDPQPPSCATGHCCGENEGSLLTTVSPDQRMLAEGSAPSTTAKPATQNGNAERPRH